MKTLKYLFFLILFALTACNGSDNDNAMQAQITALQNQVSALTKTPSDATAVASLQAEMSELHIVGKLKGVVATSLKMQGEFRTSAISPATTFGGCQDMGIYSGQGGSDSANPLASQFEIYRQTPTETCPGATTSYNETTGLHDRLVFAAWDQPGCHGNMYVETDVPQNSMSLAALQGILVMLSPDPSDNRDYASALGSTPQPVAIQSSMNGSPNGRICGVDQETRMAILMAPNSTTVSGVPHALVPGSWAKVAP